MVNQSINNIAEICFQKGIKNIVLSPGSRCAPLTVAFVRHPGLKTFSIPDERSAAFIALGMAQQSKLPVVLVCTSGTAALNYYPAIAEAYYQQIPLIVITADRPDEWIDQLDGQTIRQQNVYSNHIKKCYQLPVDYSHPDAHWYVNRVVNEAINISQDLDKGPVHINVPFREPFYPEPTEEIVFDKNVRIINHHNCVIQLDNLVEKYIVEQLNLSKKILIVVGQYEYDLNLINHLNEFCNTYKIPVLADIISNVPVDNKIYHSDITLFNKQLHVNLHPDLVISFGKSILSKNVKNWLRNTKIKTHIHLQNGSQIADYSQSITTIINIQPSQFFNQLLQNTLNVDCSSYLKLWQDTEQSFEDKLTKHFSNSQFSEFEAVYTIVSHLPENSILQLANSMSVRYANYLKIDKSIQVLSNRGTSGIDGCSSTALGCALETDKIVTLITGDIAFLYDRNAFWNNYLPKNLRVVVLNNNAGGIFRIIDGSNKLPELQEYFETIQNNNICDLEFEKVFLCDLVDKKDVLIDKCVDFYKKSDNPKLIEVKTDAKINTEVLKEFTIQYKK